MASLKDKKEIRLRIAPSPTGHPHIGTIYQALFNYAFAKKNKGKFIVRIEDTDRARFVKDAEEKIYESLDYFSLSEDESPRKEGEYGPYRQSERLDIYHKYAQELYEKGGAYFSFYPKDENDTEYKDSEVSSVKEMLEVKNWVLRLKIPEEKKVIVHDEIRGDIEFDTGQITDQVLLKSDGFPTYHLAVVIDDHLMKITDTVRGEEWISSSPKHQILYKYFGWDIPRFYHTPVLRNPDRSKLSKRQGHTNVAWYLEQGYIKEAILNFLALLGWSHPQEKEIFTLDEFITLMDLKDIKPVGPIFDINKLEWMSGEYIRQIPVKELAKKIKEFDGLFEKIEPQNLEKLAEIARTRIKKLSEFGEMFSPFLFPEKKEEENETNSLTAENISSLSANLENISDWKKEEIHLKIREFLDENNLRFPDIYLFLTGKKFGPPLADTFEILGKETTLRLLSSRT